MLNLLFFYFYKYFVSLKKSQLQDTLYANDFFVYKYNFFSSGQIKFKKKLFCIVKFRV